MLRIGCASGVLFVIMLGTYNFISAPETNVNQKYPPRFPMPSLKPEQRFPALVQPPKPSTKNPNNKPPNNQLPKQKWWEEDFDKRSYDDVISTPKYDPLEGVNPDFIWDGTKKEKNADDKYIFPRTVDPGVRFVGTKPNRKVGRRPRLPIKIQPEGFQPPVWKKPKNVDNGKYDPNWDKPRFQEEVTLTTVDEDDFYTMDEEFSPPRFPAGKARGRPIKNNLEPEWDEEEFYGQGKKKEGASFGRQPQEIEWW